MYRKQQGGMRRGLRYLMIRNTGYVLTATQQQGRWALVTECDWAAGHLSPIRHFPARQEIGAVLWAEAWTTLKKLAEIPTELNALMSEDVVADRVYEVPPAYYLLVLEDRLDRRDRYLMREGRLPILFPGCDNDAEAVREARELVTRGALDD